MFSTVVQDHFKRARRPTIIFLSCVPNLCKKETMEPTTISSVASSSETAWTESQEEMLMLMIPTTEGDETDEEEENCPPESLASSCCSAAVSVIAPPHSTTKQQDCFSSPNKNKKVHLLDRWNSWMFGHIEAGIFPPAFVVLHLFRLHQVYGYLERRDSNSICQMIAIHGQCTSLTEYVTAIDFGCSFPSGAEETNSPWHSIVVIPGSDPTQWKHYKTNNRNRPGVSDCVVSPVWKHPSKLPVDEAFPLVAEFGGFAMQKHKKKRLRSPGWLTYRRDQGVLLLCHGAPKSATSTAAYSNCCCLDPSTTALGDRGMYDAPPPEAVLAVRTGVFVLSMQELFLVVEKVLKEEWLLEESDDVSSGTKRK